MQGPGWPYKIKRNELTERNRERAWVPGTGNRAAKVGKKRNRCI